MTMKTKCPVCGKEYNELANFCGDCGVELKSEPNRCSAEKYPLCKGRTVPDNQKYCIYCGALTTYAVIRTDGEW